MATTKRRRRRTRSQIEFDNALPFMVILTLYGLSFLFNNYVWLTAILVGSISLYLAYKRLTRHRKRQKLLLQGIDTLGKDGTEFEECIKLLFEDLGWKDIHRVGGGGDGGVDLIAKYGPHKYIVQCKYYKPGHSVGSPVIRDLMGAREDQGAYQALLVTTSHLSAPAKETADRNDIRYWEREELGRRLRMAAEHKQSPQVKQQQFLQAYMFWGGLLVINAAVITGTLWIIARGL